MTQETILSIRLDKIRDDNIRKTFSEEELHGLMQSMHEVGQLQPIRVRQIGNLYWPVDGGRRVLAARRAGWEEIAAIIECKELSDAAAKQRSLISNCQKEDMPPLDIAAAIDDLMKGMAWNATEAAAKLGFSNAKVSRLLSLLKLPESIRDGIRDGAIPSSAASDLARVEDAGQQSALAQRMASGELTRDGLSGVVKRRRASSSEKQSPSTARVTAALGNGRSVTLVGNGLSSLDALISWLEELLAKARKFRPKGLELGTFIRILRDEAKTP